MVAVIMLAFLAAPLTAGAQLAGRVVRVGLLNDILLGPVPDLHLAFRHALRDLGWIEGRNLIVEERYAETPEQRREHSVEMERLRVDVIVASPAVALRVSSAGTAPIRDIPIVFAFSDPINAKMVKSLARPGGNMTGVATLIIELNVKRLQLLKEALPELTRVGVLVPSNHPLRDSMVKPIAAAAPALNIKLQLFDVASTEPSEKIGGVFDAMAASKVQAVLGIQGPHYFRERNRIAVLALKHRLPGIFEATQYADAGNLMSYSPNYVDIYRHLARYVDNILRGAKPADLPVEQPRKFEFVINLRTAKALGLTLPQSLLLRADRVIE
jgi:putative ABC transport system substrate-binding protein